HSRRPPPSARALLWSARCLRSRHRAHEQRRRAPTARTEAGRGATVRRLTSSSCASGDEFSPRERSEHLTTAASRGDDAMSLPEITTRAEWLSARKQLLDK